MHTRPVAAVHEILVFFAGGGQRCTTQLQAAYKALQEAENCCSWAVHLVLQTFRMVCALEGMSVMQKVFVSYICPCGHTALNISTTLCAVQLHQISS